jgi:excisionase family DNA binding protein
MADAHRRRSSPCFRPLASQNRFQNVVMKSLQPPSGKTAKTEQTFMDDSEPNQITEQLRKKERVERLAYSIPEAADMLGLDYFSVYRLVQRGKLKACRALRGKFLITRAELDRLLNTE